MDEANDVEMQMEVSSAIFASDSAAWRKQIIDLTTELQRANIQWRREEMPLPGHKGAAEAIILALGSSGAIAAVVTIFRAWLARPGDRSIILSGMVKGKSVALEITGGNVSEKTLLEVLKLTV